MEPATPLILCVNPWVYDFAAHDYFARPLGLLYLAGLLRARGFQVALLDLASRPPDSLGPKGRWPKEILPTPPQFQDVPRRYGRYGLSPGQAAAYLARLPQEPAAVLVTSLMTYWYPGIQAAIAAVRSHYPEVPVILGGIYASLLPEHARQHSGADVVIPGPGEEAILPLLADLSGVDLSITTDLADWDALPYPAWDLLADRQVLPLLTSRGCPCRCDYCASRLLEPRFRRRRAESILAELDYWHTHFGVREIAWYDDALLFEAENYLLPVLESVCRRNLSLRFHTPNGLHVGLITPQVARWLKRANFATLRLGFETASLGEARRDRKIQAGDLERAVAALKEAGFAKTEIGVYLLMGLPEQTDDEVAQSIREVHRLGATPVLTQYSPIPGTALWPEAVKVSRYDLEREPLYHNNSIFPCWPEFSWERYTRLKNLALGKS